MQLACSVQDVRDARGLKAVTIGPRELVVVEDRATGAVFAIDRACPHQGSRLEEGTVGAGTITCDWHGWRFDLETGTCLTGGEDVRSYATELRGGDVYVDALVAPSAGELDAAADALVSALEAGDPGAAARRAAGLVRLGAPLERVATILVRFAATHGAGPVRLEAVAISDVLDLAPHLPAGAVSTLAADVAAGVAERYGRATLRFGPDPATPAAWVGTSARGALARALAVDELEAEALTAGMVRSGVPLGEIAAALACGATDGLRDPEALLVAERAVRLSAALGPDVARVLLPPVAATIAAATVAPERSAIARAVAGLAGSSTDPAAVIEDCGLILSRFDASVEDDPHGVGSRLGVGIALAYAGASVWAATVAAPAASPASRSASPEYALALAQVASGAVGATTITEPEPCVPEEGIARALAAGPANTSAGLATCLAATRVAVLAGGEQARRGTYRLLTATKRERFTARDIAAS